LFFIETFIFIFNQWIDDDRERLKLLVEPVFYVE
jgi:hypothetical protein